MKDKLQKISQQYGEGLMTDREFLGKVIEIVGDKWQGMTESENANPEVIWLAGAID